MCWAFSKLDPQDIPDTSSVVLPTFCEEEIKKLPDYYGKSKVETFIGRTIRSKASISTTAEALKGKYSGYKIYVVQQKKKLSRGV